MAGPCQPTATTRSPAFITLHGIVAFLCGGVLAALALLVAVVQVAFALNRRELMPFFPQALGATAVAFLTGVWLVLASEFRWVSGELLDNLCVPLSIAALGWVFYHRMGSRRSRGAAAPKPD